MLDDLLRDVLSTQEAWAKEERFDLLPLKHQAALKHASKLAGKIKGRLADDEAEILEEFIASIDSNNFDLDAVRMLFSALSSSEVLNKGERLMCCDVVVKMGMVIHDKNRGII